MHVWRKMVSFVHWNGIGHGGWRKISHNKFFTQFSGMSTRTLYVTDLDGTLLGADSCISARSRQMINDLVERGVMITPATARTPATVQLLFDGVRQSVYRDEAGELRPLPAIVMTGAGMWDRETVRFESCRLIPEEDAMRIRDTFDRESLRPFVYCLSGDNFLNVYHSSKMTRRENAFYQDRRHLELKRFHLDQTPSRWDRVVLFFAIGPEGTVTKVSEELGRATECASAWYPDIVLPDTGLMDIYAPGVSKAHAVSELAARVGADRVVVFGDNLNDLPMMEVADVAVAMGNALPDVKAKADVVIGLNTEDAVAEFIMKCES